MSGPAISAHTVAGLEKRSDLACGVPFAMRRAPFALEPTGPYGEVRSAASKVVGWTAFGRAEEKRRR